MVLYPEEGVVASDVVVDLGRVARLMSELADRLRDTPDSQLAQAVVDMAVELVPMARWASITIRRGERFESLAASDDLARRIDTLQYEVSSGPCLDSVLHETTHIVRDLAQDRRWPQYGAEVVPLGVRSVVAHCLHLTGNQPMLAALNVYSDRVDAFGQEALWACATLATYGALAVSLDMSRLHLDNLEKALHSNREIGVAMGVLMGAHRITREEAFSLLRLVSQNTNRKLVEVAAEVVRTGELDPQPREGT